jgi:glycosyltransferase involved in cell wall biosynthesis
MKIVIYDTRHYEMVNVLFRIYNTDGNQILFLISPAVYKKLQAASEKDLGKHLFVVEKENENPNDYFSRCYSELQKFNPDFHHFNTIDKDYKHVWGFLKKILQPYIVTIHNINTWLKPPFTLNRIALSNYYFRKKIIGKSSALVVQEELFINYITKNNLYKKPLLAIPHTLKEVEPEKTSNQKIVITIPGAIDGLRRDIDLALDVIEEVHKQSDHFQFVFAGNVIGYLGEPIWERAKRLQKQGLDIQQFYDPASNKVFDEQMKRCDLIFLPLNVNTKFEGIPEIYGTTKVTGVIYDMMRFCKPGIVPAAMVIPPTMSTSILSYQNKNELVNMILSLANNKTKLEELKTAAEKNSFYYTEAEIRKRVLPKIQKKLLFLNT